MGCADESPAGRWLSGHAHRGLGAGPAISPWDPHRHLPRPGHAADPVRRDHHRVHRPSRPSRPWHPEVPQHPRHQRVRQKRDLFGLWQARRALERGPAGHRRRPVLRHRRHYRRTWPYVGLAPCGTALTASDAATLARAADLRATGVTVAFDPDKAGRRATIRAYHLLVPLTEKLAALTLPSGQDRSPGLADLSAATLAEMLSNRIQPLPDLVINTEVARWGRWLRYPEGQIHALRAAAPLIAAMPPAHIARQVARLAAILQARPRDRDRSRHRRPQRIGRQSSRQLPPRDHGQSGRPARTTCHGRPRRQPRIPPQRPASRQARDDISTAARPGHASRC